MKAPFLCTLIFFCFAWPLLAQQHPLVGTWEVVSIKGTDTDGTKISADGTQFKETKIITPTHYILFTERKQGDSLVFDKAIAGTIRVEGNKYIETPVYFSDEAHGKGKTNFTYKLDGNTFIQAGTVITPEGKTATIDELVFKKVKETNAPTHPAIGTWNQLSSSGTGTDGQKWSHTNATHIRFQIITPSHWMRISYKDNKFENAMGGTYHIEGNKVHPGFEMASFPAEEFTAEITQRVEGNKLYWSGMVTDAKGKMTFDDVFERVGTKAAKTAAK